MFYVCSKFTGTARGAEGQPIRWVTWSELLELQPQFLDGDDAFALKIASMMKDHEAER